MPVGIGAPWTVSRDTGQAATSRRPATWSFQGADDGAFYAFHAATGEQLFRYQAPRPIRCNGEELGPSFAMNIGAAFQKLPTDSQSAL